ncbi:hypothetical protein N6H14_28415 [Paenibacillus sp. CC-CFT747]|nr:hypothetical protein N6H14_28415 [Paenibacillus sp. CC-CFT747]
MPSGWSSVIPNWTFFWVNACVEYYERTGDLGFAASIYPHAAYTLDHYLMKRDEHGLLSLNAWNFLDWAPIDQPREGIVSHQNMFLVKALQEAPSWLPWLVITRRRRNIQPRPGILRNRSTPICGRRISRLT